MSIKEVTDCTTSDRIEWHKRICETNPNYFVKDP